MVNPKHAVNVPTGAAADVATIEAATNAEMHIQEVHTREVTATRCEMSVSPGDQVIKGQTRDARGSKGGTTGFRPTAPAMRLDDSLKALLTGHAITLRSKGSR